LKTCYAAMLRLWFTTVVAMISVSPAVIRAETPTTPAPIPSHIPRQRVESTAIAAIGYSKRRHILEIEFVNGAIYRYLDVPPAVYRNLMSAESKARFYDSNIRRHYRSIPIRPRQKGDNHE
jgi:KTSC domain